MSITEMAMRDRRRRRSHRGFRMPAGGQAKTVTFGPATALGVRAWIALGADLTQSWLTWNWAEITDFVRWEQGVVTSQGRRQHDDTVAPSTANATLDNRDGRFARHNPTGPYFGLLSRFTPIRFANDPGTGYEHRYFGFINDLPKRWADKSANDAVVNIVCRGPMHRLVRQQAHTSPLYGSLRGLVSGSFAPQCYIPMEDGTAATQFASGILGNPAMTYTGDVAPAGDGTLTGSKPLPVFGSTGRAFTTIPAYTDTGFGHYMTLCFIPASLSAVARISLLTVQTTSTTHASITVSIKPATNELQVDMYSPAGASAYSASVPVSGGRSTGVGDWFWCVLTLRKDYSGTDDHFQADFILVTSPDGSNSFAGLGDLIGASGYGQGTASGVNGTLSPIPAAGDGVSYGHLHFLTDAAFDISGDVRDYAAPAEGWPGELTHTRIRRICAEAGIGLLCGAVTSAALGSQPQGNALEILREAALADQGLLYEHEYGLGYQALSQRYNQPVSMTVDIAPGQVIEDLEPADDDLRFRNRWTVHRKNGSFTVAVPEGGLTVQDLIYDGEETFSLATDTQTGQVANWLIHRDTIDEDYWPNIGFSLRKNPELITGWLALPYGGRINVNGVMSQAGVSTIDAIVEGWTERWNSLMWEVTLNTSPASIYSVGIYATAEVLPRYDSANSALSAAIGDVDVTLTVATDSGHAPWITTASFASQLPFDIGIGGEQITITDITSPTTPQTFTGVRSVNGVVKSHNAGARVRLWTPARYAL